ncbi:MAG: gliding motility-associated C-terminal domain-containing protein [Cytophagaceae bacterium]|jgi:hypothetical protein|nr:gliding motility-associated C-terminal domain-containing protein [Cytophagaceae bacterium]
MFSSKSEMQANASSLFLPCILPRPIGLVAALRIILFFLLFQSVSLHAQIDREFWFAAPEITELHADEPIYLYVTTLDQPAQISLTQPANPGFVPITRSLAANSQVRIPLSAYKNSIETRPYNSILEKGLLLSSSSPVTAYYEVLGSNRWGVGINSDIFALKGQRALGKEFLIPFQTHWDNYAGINAYASFDIVATEDNTKITITPSSDLMGHPAGIPFDIFLNKGQVYSCQAASILGSERPKGSVVISDKPIAVTVKDDSIFEDRSYDTAGDQLIPVQVAGTQYVATSISRDQEDRVYVLATQDNTELFLDGSSTAIATLQRGEQYEIHLLNPTVLINASNPVYVFHVTGFQNELGGALLPPLGCTGSKNVSVSRSTIEEFQLIILCETGGESFFTINGNSQFLQASDFQPVAGSAGALMFAKISLTTTEFPIDYVINVQNSTKNFHLGTCNGATVTGFRYGYFSDFGFLELGDAQQFCKENTIRIDANSFMDSYVWTKKPSATVLSTDKFLITSDTGEFIITGTKGICTFKDSIKLSYAPEIVGEILGADTFSCRNIPLIVKSLQSFPTYIWSNGSRELTTIAGESGWLYLEVRNNFDCSKKDSMRITLYDLPEPSLSLDTTKPSACFLPTISLSGNSGHSTYLWSNGSTNQQTVYVLDTISGNNTFSLEVSNAQGCKNTVSATFDCSTEFGLLPNLITNNKDGKNDGFIIPNLKLGRWTLQVFNQWGNLIYKDDAYQNNWQPQDLSAGVYYFFLTHNDYDIERKGWLHILND